MPDICKNLPELVLFDVFNNDWNSFLDHLYKIYIDDFFNNTVRYKNLPIKTFQNLDYNGKQQTFNHITTKGSDDRLYNQLRCERYKWIKAIIESEVCNSCSEISTWIEKDKNKHRVLIWCRTTDFLIILEKRNDLYYLISAYCVIYENKKRDLQSSYEKYVRENQNRLSRR